MKQEFEKIERQKKWWVDILTVFFVFYFSFFPNVFFQPRFVFALTENEGTDFTVCTAGATFVDDGGGGFDVTFYWVFDVQQNDYFDDDGLPLTAQGDPSVDTPVMAAATQQTYWLEVDDDNNFSSPLVQQVATTTDEYYHYTGGGITVDRTWFWRIKIKDSYDSITDWVSGGSFSLNTQTKLKGKIKLKGNIFF